MRPPVPATLKRELLQWGRDLSVAEMSLEVSHTILPSKLQWGRDLSVAEMEPHQVE